MSIEKLKDTLQNLGLVDMAQKRGCTPDEIRALETKYAVQLPASYRSFLEEFGHGGADIFDRKEIDFDYDKVLEITEFVFSFRKKVEERIADICEREGRSSHSDEKFSALPENVLFIANRYGAQFFYIIAVGGEDCPVYYYSFDTEEGMDIQKKSHDSVWEWLAVNARETKAMRDRTHFAAAG